KFLSHDLAADESAKKRFIREAQAASALEHPSICHINEINETPDGRVFMVMPFYEGETLGERLDRGPLEAAAALDIVIPLASGLARAHAKGIVHRDIKPGNVMLADDGRQARLMDFGLAKKLDASKMTRTGTTVGTVAYMSPEQALGKETDHRTDIWSMGVLLFEMVTGTSPFRGDVEPAMLYSIINERPKLVTSVRPEMPGGLEGIIEKMLEKDPAKRYATMDDVVSDLENLREKIKMGISERKFAALRRRTRRRRGLVSAGIIAVITVAAVVVIRVLFGPHPVVTPAIAVVPVVSNAGDDETQRMTRSMARMLTTDLGESNHIRVLGSAALQQIMLNRKLLDNSE
ncbi:MAG: serine/threonine-protein kinase, partial [bacterium]